METSTLRARVVRRKNWIPDVLYRRAQRLWHHWYLPRQYLLPDDPAVLAEYGYDFVPPVHLRHRVHGNTDLRSFLSQAESQYSVLQPIDGRTLDFGCGCGRTALAIRKNAPDVDYVGVDIDPDCIEWDALTMSQWRFLVCDRMPPLPFPEGEFDTILSISVVTHLSEAMQDAWLHELHRLARLGGRLFISIISERGSGQLPTKLRKQLRSKGLLHLEAVSPTGPGEEYANTYHSWAYVQEHWSRWFAIESRRALGGIQDVVVLRRRDL